jgi:YVTN family beta-propeller protein
VRRFELAGDLSNMDVGFDSLWVGANDGTVAYRVHPDGRVDTLQVDAQGPSSFAVGRDAVWVTARPGDVVRRIDPATNELGPPIAVGSNPTMGAEAADGSIVVPNTGDGTLSRIDPSRNAVVETIRVGSRPVKVVRVGGALWVTHLGGNAVWRVNLVS